MSQDSLLERRYKVIMDLKGRVAELENLNANLIDKLNTLLSGEDGEVIRHLLSLNSDLKRDLAMAVNKNDYLKARTRQAERHVAWVENTEYFHFMLDRDKVDVSLEPNVVSVCGGLHNPELFSFINGYDIIIRSKDITFDSLDYTLRINRSVIERREIGQ